MNRMIATLLFVLLSMFSLDAQVHDFHVCVMDVEKTEQNQARVTVKIFFDDLLLACNLNPGEPLPEHYTSADDLILDYLQKHLEFIQNGKNVPFSMMDTASGANMAVWITLDIPSIEDDPITIQNTILLKEFDDQVNIINIYAEDGDQSTHAMDKDKTTLNIKL